MAAKFSHCTADLAVPQTPADSALDVLAGDFVASTAAPTVKSAVCAPSETDQQVSECKRTLSILCFV